MAILVACERSQIVTKVFRELGFEAFSCDIEETEGNKDWHFKAKIKDGRQQEGIDFFMQFTEVPCQLVAIENPIGIMSTIYRKPDQIIQPWQFGHATTKATCLWLKGLPKLKKHL